MTKKDFEVIADMLRRLNEERGVLVLGSTAEEVVNECLSATNPRFDANKFWQRVIGGVKPPRGGCGKTCGKH